MTSSTPRAAPWLMLVARLGLFAAFQLAIALLLGVFGGSAPWHDSQGWWLISVLLANVVTIAVLARLQQMEGKPYVDLLNFRRASVGKDILIAFGVLLLSAPISTLPNMWLGQLLFRSSDATFPMMFRALPLWAAILGLLMPVTHAFAELPTYFGYSMPRLGISLGRPWLAWAIASFFLALQHVAAPWSISRWRSLFWA